MLFSGPRPQSKTAAALLLLLLPLLALVVSLSPYVSAATSIQVTQSSSSSTDHHQVATASGGTGGHDSAAARPRFVMPKLFDFDQFKQTFGKRYRSIVEELIRRKYMLARAFRAFISAMKYKFRKLSYHLSVNHMSDLSPAELELMRNQAMLEQGANWAPSLVDSLAKRASNATNPAAAAAAAPAATTAPQVNRPQVDQIDPNQVEASLEELRQLGASSDSRMRRQLDELTSTSEADTAGHGGRPVSLESLVNTGRGARLDAETSAKVEASPSGNNPDYEPPELESQGLRDEKLEQIPYVALYPAPRQPAQQPAASLEDMLEGLFADQADEEATLDADGDTQMVEPVAAQDQGQDQDQVYVDHRRSRCMFLPRDQGLCGSCYAFSLIAMAEWLYCIRSGHLVPFSEQYVVDCGQSTGGRGCRGGNVFELGNFVHNYGLELRKNYPYLGREEQCPYDADTDPKRMGFIRMDLGGASVVPVESFELYLEYGPIFVAVCTRGDFVEYGAGVHDSPTECAGQPPDHAMVLIGHGREDGQQYWLIRNSHSIGWGLQGHYKLAKGSACLRTAGVMFGTTNGAQFEVRPARNEQNDATVVRARYTQQMHHGGR